MPRLLVTGASGFLGGELLARAPGRGWTATGTRHTRAGAGLAALDVRDAGAVRALLAALAPDAVVHTAYRQTGEDAEAVTLGGAAAVAAAATEAGARLVHLSSDAVFRGGLGRALREDDPPDPITAYGAAKARAEEAVSAAHPGAVLVRTSLIYGGPGHALSGHEELALAAARGERRDVTFFTNELRSPVQVGDLAEALLELAAAPAVSGPLHVAGADTVSRLAFAQLVAATHGLDPASLRGGESGPERPADVTLDSTRARSLLGTRLRGVREVLAP